MKHKDSDLNETSVKYTAENFESWANRDYISGDLKQNVLKSSILFVPFENLRDSGHNAFPVGTIEIYEYMKENAPDDVILELCSSDDDYKELDLRSDLIVLGNFVVREFMLPVFIGLFSSYVYDKIKYRDKGTRVRFSVTSVSEGGSKYLYHEGSPNGIEKIQQFLDDLRRPEANDSE